MPTKTKSKPNPRRAPPKRKPSARKKSTAVMVRKSKADKPAVRVIYVPQQRAGVRVTHDNALTVSAFWAGVRCLTNPLSYMSWHVMERDGDGKKRRSDLWTEWLLNSQPNGEMSAGTFREVILAHAITWGNGYAEIERDGSGRPLALWLLPPDRVEPVRVDGNGIWYEVHNNTGPDTYIPARDMFHLKGLGFDGLVGYSLVRMMARSLGIAMALEENSSSFFGNGSRPAGVLTYAGRINTETRDETRKEWNRQHGGPTKSGNIAILDQGLKFEPMSLNNVDSQMVESQQFRVTDAARWLGVPPHKLADLENAHFNNIEEQNLDFLQTALMPWINRLEQEADIKLFGPQSQGRLFTRINIKSLMRGNSAAQAAFLTAMVDRGIYSINEARDYLDLDPIGTDGDKRLFPMNFTTLDNAGEENEPASAEPVDPIEDADEEDTEDETNPQNRLNGHGVIA
jgi:HK97 family phage portal protein